MEFFSEMWASMTTGMWSGAFAVLIVLTTMGFLGILIAPKLDKIIEAKHLANSGGLQTA
ncbi:MAG: hypothetical protein FWE23_04570 [Chitinivibrionia bacterium]|jgi:hypothetical protein|nr:hypothetical protein [Chitinivibrionia bacterium]